MAYISQDRKKTIAAALKKALKGSGLTYSLGVDHHTALVMNIWSGPVDFIANYRETIQTKRHWGRQADEWKGAPTNYMQVNEFHYEDQYTGKALDLLKTIIPILNEGNHDNSDIQSDYFDVGWYLNINIGRWNKPYQLTK